MQEKFNLNQDNLHSEHIYIEKLLTLLSDFLYLK